MSPGGLRQMINKCKIYNGDILTHKFDEKYDIIIADPPYGNIVKDGWDKYNSDKLVEFWLEMFKVFSNLQDKGDVVCFWGGIGKPKDRPFYKFCSIVEDQTEYVIKNHITWSKKRSYGVKDNYLFTREELLYLIKGTNKPNVFNIPLLDVKRGYAGYNEKYPAKSEYKRRTNVWTDITEIFKGKVHVAQKPVDLHKICIETHMKDGSNVLDPCCGSGSVGVAANSLGVKSTLIEKDETNYRIAMENVNNF